MTLEQLSRVVRNRGHKPGPPGQHSEDPPVYVVGCGRCGMTGYLTDEGAGSGQALVMDCPIADE